MLKVKSLLKNKKELIDKELEVLIPAAKECPKTIHKAMRYALRGGKRIRPILCIACAEIAGAKPQQALKTACAIEIAHTYSLVHDDLPSMDNDDYRRGRPSCHRKFSIANAILTGDALLTLSFNILSEATPKPDLNSKIIKELSRAIGTFGMIGGQAIDIEPGEKNFAALEYINIRKTGALIAASCKIGGMVARAEKKQIKALLGFGEYIGVVFQIVDDILDNEGFAKAMGKRKAYEHAREMADKAKAQLKIFKKRSNTLCELADFILNRKY